MPKGQPLDLGVIHALLWEESDRVGRYRLNQAKLAVQLGITKFTMSRTIATLIEQKRIRRISHMRQNSGMFVVEEPSVWAETYGAVW